MEQRPWGIQAIGDMYSPDVAAGLPDGSWAAAVAEPYSCNIFESIRAAWWVLTGRAHAVIWPKAGDIERALGIPGPRRRPPGDPARQYRAEQRATNWLGY